MLRKLISVSALSVALAACSQVDTGTNTLNSSRKIFLQGYEQYKAGDLVSAERSFETALAQNPSNAYASLALGAVKERTGRFDEARSLYQTAIRDGGGSIGNFLFITEKNLERPQSVGVAELARMNLAELNATQYATGAVTQTGNLGFIDYDANVAPTYIEPVSVDTTYTAPLSTGTYQSVPASTSVLYSDESLNITYTGPADSAPQIETNVIQGGPIYETIDAPQSYGVSIEAAPIYEQATPSPSYTTVEPSYGTYVPAQPAEPVGNYESIGAYQTAPSFDVTPSYNAAPSYEAAPAYGSGPIYDPAPISYSEPIYTPAPVTYSEPAPTFTPIYGQSTVETAPVYTPVPTQPSYATAPASPIYDTVPLGGLSVSPIVDDGAQLITPSSSTSIETVQPIGSAGDLIYLGDPSGVSIRPTY